MSTKRFKKSYVIAVLAILLATIVTANNIRKDENKIRETKHEYYSHILPQPINIQISPEELDTNKQMSVNEYIKRSDDMLRTIHKINAQSSSGANQLYLFLQNPFERTYIYIGLATILCITILYLSKRFIKRLYKYLLSSIFICGLILAFLDLSLPLTQSTRNDIDIFFVGICFLTISLSIYSIIIHLVPLLWNKKITSKIRLQRVEQRRYFILWSAITCWLLAYLIFFIGMYSSGTQKSVLTALLRPALSASKMFLMADNINDLAAALRNNGAFMGFYSCVKIFILLVTSSTLIYLIFYRWKVYLKTSLENAKGKKVFVFFDMTRISKIMAQNIKRHVAENDCVILFVENKKDNINLFKSVSFGEILKLFKHRPKAYETVDEIGANMVLSNIMIAGSACSEFLNKALNESLSPKEIMQCLGLKHFYRLINEAKETHIFFMDDNEEINIEGASNIRRLINTTLTSKEDLIKIYCLARRNIKNQILEIPSTEVNKDITEVKILDSSRLSVQQILQNPDFHPVRFVECDITTGTVKSRFEALVIGFGETGQDITKFLYEFGAFLDYQCAQDENMNFRSPFHCNIIDKNMNTLEVAFKDKVPAINNAYNMVYNNGKWETNQNDPMLSFHSAQYIDQEYINLTEKILKTTNYIVIALGQDEDNMNVLTDLMERIIKIRKGNLSNIKIFIRSYNNDYRNAMHNQVAYYNKLLDTKLIHVFGEENKLFTYKMVIGDEIISNAKKFNKAYLKIKNDPNEDSWDKRHQKARGKEGELSWGSRQGIIRKEQQDINNFLHKDTKLFLIGNPKTTIELNQFIYSIEFKDEGGKYEFTSYFDEKNYKQLYTNLARCEHLRWNASHEMLGYLPPHTAHTETQAGCNESEKTHNCLVPWDKLPHVTDIHNTLQPEYPVNYQAYDFLVVKTSFEVMKEEINS